MSESGLAARRWGFRPVGVLRRYEHDADGTGWHDGLLMDLLAEELQPRRDGVPDPRRE